MLKVKSFCCRFSLKTGSIIIVSILMPLQTAIFLGIFILMNFSPLEDSNNGTDTPTSNFEDSVDDIDELIEVILLATYVSGIALYGSIKEKPKKIVNYLILQIVYLILIASLVACLIIVPFLMLTFLNLDERFQIPLILTLISLFGTLSYFLVVVFSYYQELKCADRRHVSHPSMNIPMSTV